MAARGQNEGFHILDELVCEAIHAPSVPLANPHNQGQNEGMSVVEELVFEPGSEVSNGSGVSAECRATLPEAPDAALVGAVKPLAMCISASSNPRVALARALELLLAELLNWNEPSPQRQPPTN